MIKSLHFKSGASINFGPDNLKSNEGLEFHYIDGDRIEITEEMYIYLLCKINKHQITQKCLFFNDAWRNVCLSCGRVEIDGEWKKIYDL